MPRITRWCIGFAAFHFSLALLWCQTSPPDRHVEFGIDSYLGLHHLGTEMSTSIKPTSVDRTNYLDAVRDLGVSTVRDNVFSWSEIQPTRTSAYDFSDTDDFARKASERGLDVLSMFYFFPPWATVDEDRPWTFPTPDDGRYKLPLRKYEGEFKQVVRATVERYCGCQPGSLPLPKPIRHFVFMNEAEGYAGQFLNADEYAHWLRIFYEQVKSVDPAAQVVAPALTAPGSWNKDLWLGKFLEDMLASQELQGPHYPYFDILDFHPYPLAYGPPHPNIYAINIAASYLRDVQRKYQLNLPMWITEIGDNSADPILQADRDVKYAVQSASVGVARVYIFGLWDYQHNEWGRWGLLEDSQSGTIPVRKPSFVAYHTLLRKITDNQGIDFLAPGCFRVFKPSGPPLYVLWAEGDHTGTPEFLHGRLRVTDLRGRETEMDTKELKLDSHPVLVETEKR